MTDGRFVGTALPAPPECSQPVTRATLCAGYRSRLETLYRCESKSLRAWLVRRVGHDAAEDLAHDVFLRAARCAQLCDLHNPRGFLRRIARNLIIDGVRRQHQMRSAVPLFESIDTATEPEQEAGLHERETFAAYESSLALLPARTALIFSMSRVEQKTYRQIGEELMITPATVEYHMMRALRCLRSRLAEARGDLVAARQI